MCYSFTASVVAAVTVLVTAVVAFFLVRRINIVAASMLLVWGVVMGLMQTAEAFMWSTIPSKSGCLANTRFGYFANTLQPVAILLFALFWTRADWRFTASLTTLLAAYLVILYAAAGPEMFPQVCSGLTSEGHLEQPYWYSPVAVAAYFIAFTIGLLAVSIRWPFLIAFYGTWALSMLIYRNDSVGSTWCFAVVFVPIVLAAYYLLRYRNGRVSHIAPVEQASLADKHQV